MLRLLGALFLIVGLFFLVTIIGWFVGLWFMLFGVLLLIFGGSSRRVVVEYRDEEPRRQDRPRKDNRKMRLEQQASPPRADAADNFNEAVRLYQQHHGHEDAGSAIRVLASDALRRQGFLR